MGTSKQILEELSQAVAIWIADLARESERKAQEIRAQMMEADAAAPETQRK